MYESLAILQQTGLLPEHHIVGETFRFVVQNQSLSWRQNILPELDTVWTMVRTAETDKMSRLVASFADRQSGYSALSVYSEQTDCGRILGTRVLVWPNGIPSSRLLAITSSRLGRSVEEERKWLQFVRAACRRVEDHEMVLVDLTTWAGPIVSQACELFSASRLHCHVGKESQSLVEWLEMIASKQNAEESTLGSILYVSPRLSPIEGSEHVSIEKNTQPRSVSPAGADTISFAICDRLLALHVRAGGNIDRLLRARIVDKVREPAATQLAVGNATTPVKLRDQLLELGAVGWTILEEPPRIGQKSLITSTAKVIGPRGSGKPVSERFSVDANCIQTWSWLSHCTRRQPGAWPGQSKDEYLRNLVLAHSDSDHSAFGALRRILNEQRLRSSAAGIRGGFRVVSFTAVPLGELKSLRVFRPHRGRWDFEPFGVCIDRVWLEDQGAREVQYADDDEWRCCSDAEKPFFQRASSKTQDGKTIRWTVEQEWRHIGDVDLERLPADKAMVFVCSRQEADLLAQSSRWPVYWLE